MPGLRSSRGARDAAPGGLAGRSPARRSGGVGRPPALAHLLLATRSRRRGVVTVHQEHLPPWMKWQHRLFPDANLLLLKGRDAALVDSGFVGHADETTEWVNAHTDNLRLVVNTHWHSDHVGGNAVLQSAGAAIAGSSLDAPGSFPACGRRPTAEHHARGFRGRSVGNDARQRRHPDSGRAAARRRRTLARAPASTAGTVPPGMAAGPIDTVESGAGPLLIGVRGAACVGTACRTRPGIRPAGDPN